MTHEDESLKQRILFVTFNRVTQEDLKKMSQLCCLLLLNVHGSKKFKEVKEIVLVALKHSLAGCLVCHL